ncbi:hypothetical protein [Arsenicibacter rosenii]|uniref:Uncharacterized protein n=1 Tax=Arsenicibacter rosenii TaxID=1750698 RepID=A0A1S2VQF5_9BACT|nr:hypothetical protein [Arsenicibacter rosenii]OIN61013.1 hypothetical protein BLX24_02735 [Arsenicibacter rosenii]
MKTYSPDTGNTTGNDQLTNIPSGLDHDPKADEEVIDQQAGQQQPEAVQQTADNDDLANSIAYALDGSGPGPSSPGPSSDSTVTGIPHEVVIEGSSGFGPSSREHDDEEDAAREWRSL